MLDCKPIGQDCDDHHSKLVDGQGKNDDISPVFSNIPIGSAVAVQCEDGGPWTHVGQNCKIIKGCFR